MLSSLCCASSDCLRLFCSPFQRCFGLTLSHQIKLAYFLLVGVFVAIALSLLKGIRDPSDFILEQTGCSSQSPFYQYSLGTFRTKCVYTQIVIRVFVSLSVLQVLCALAVAIRRNEKAKIINEGLWLIKMVLFLALFGLSLLLGPTLTNYAYYACLQCWLLYSLLQTLCVVDLSYSIGIAIKERVEETGQIKCRVLDAAITLGLYALAIWWNVESYKLIEKWLAVCNSVGIGLLFLVAFVRINPANTLLVSAPILLYIQALTYIHGRLAEPSAFPMFSWPLESLALFLVFLTFLSMLHKGSGKVKTPNGSLNDLLGLTTQRTEETGYISTNNWVKFHVVLSVICLALPVILTQWRHASEEASRDKDWLAQIYSLVVIGWAYLAYLWSVLCVRCYPDRDLSELESYFKEFELN